MNPPAILFLTSHVYVCACIHVSLNLNCPFHLPSISPDLSRFNFYFQEKFERLNTMLKKKKNERKKEISFVFSGQLAAKIFF